VGELQVVKVLPEEKFGGYLLHGVTTPRVLYGLACALQANRLERYRVGQAGTHSLASPGLDKRVDLTVSEGGESGVLSVDGGHPEVFLPPMSWATVITKYDISNGLDRAGGVLWYVVVDVQRSTPLDFMLDLIPQRDPPHM